MHLAASLWSCLHLPHRAPHAHTQRIFDKQACIHAAVVKNLEEQMKVIQETSAVWEERAQTAERQVNQMSASIKTKLADVKRLADQAGMDNSTEAALHAQYLQQLEEKLAVSEKLNQALNERVESLRASKKSSKGSSAEIIEKLQERLTIHSMMEAELNQRITAMQQQVAAAGLATTLAKQEAEQLRAKLHNATVGAQ